MRIDVETGIILCQKYVLPILVKITKSLISKLAKNLYKKLYNQFTNAIENFETAIAKDLTVDDPAKLERNLKNCKTGLAFFEQMNIVLDNSLREYNKSIATAEARLARLRETEAK